MAHAMARYADLRNQPIETHYIYPPIPDRRFDWTAYRDPESIVGYGPTEAEAIADLLANEEVHYDD